MCFSFAPGHHPAARLAAAGRKNLAFPTIFNLLGPLANPAGATRQIVGTYSLLNAAKLAAALGRLGVERALVVHSEDGLDELTTTGINHVWHVERDAIRQERLDTQELGFGPASLDDLRAHSLDQAVDIARSVLRGEPGPRRDVVELNAGASLYVAACVPTIEQGIQDARRAILSGAALKTLERLVSITAST